MTCFCLDNPLWEVHRHDYTPNTLFPIEMMAWAEIPLSIHSPSYKGSFLQNFQQQLLYTHQTFYTHVRHPTLGWWNLTFLSENRRYLKYKRHLNVQICQTKLSPLLYPFCWVMLMLRTPLEWWRFVSALKYTQLSDMYILTRTVPVVNTHCANGQAKSEEIFIFTINVFYALW